MTASDKTKDGGSSADADTQPGSADSNARLVAELQGLTIAIHMFGLGHLAHMSHGRAYEIPKNEQVAP